MSLVVLQLAHSPYCIPITRALEALGVAFETREVGNADRRAVIEATGGAYYQVPVLLHDGRALYERSATSLDIARHVDAIFGGGRLFPEDVEGLQCILVPHVEDDIESVTFRLTDPFYMRDIADPVERAMIRRHKERKFGAGCIEQWSRERDALLAATTDLLTPFELMLRGRPFLLGEAPVFTDFALYGILGNLTYRGYNEIPAGLPRLAEWFARLGAYRFAAPPEA